ncbi:Gfo/Idh/MocA family protein [Confluentibacter flavum]|uniref:Dehydrogenase n=1 Tax=Confluentibacter flavum TaxID=1909700 RepID=A0A2N3HHP1_9FLAO|nr:Gfo/Idh/MocA family oxidoreductase [Confluentibacter flavum]PKQ44414.1 dehydrogenase [Confluentibacter flavum]
MKNISKSGRRSFIKKSSIAAFGSVLYNPLSNSSSEYNFEDKVIKIGLVGCGGRGTGALFEALSASTSVRVVAIGDTFDDNTNRVFSLLKQNFSKQCDVTTNTCFSGFDAYNKVIEFCDAIILATPPPFRPQHFEASIKAGKHVFMEKPLAVDVPGFIQIMEAGKLADQKKLNVVVGLQFRYEIGNQEMVKRIGNGEIGDITSISTYYNVGAPKVIPREPQQTEMEYQVRNWRYFTWLWGGQLAGQAIHQIDMMNWIMKDYPIKALGNGGRLVYNGQDNGDVYDHFFIEYEYKNGVKMYSQSRNMDHCSDKMGWSMNGTKGVANERQEFLDLSGNSYWRYRDNGDLGATQIEQNIFIESIIKGKHINNTEYGAKSTLTTIMGRLAAETGKEITMEALLESKISIVPTDISWESNTIKFPDKNGNYPIVKPGII